LETKLVHSSQNSCRDHSKISQLTAGSDLLIKELKLEFACARDFKKEMKMGSSRVQAIQKKGSI
jgi:hypothetical protein